MEPFLVGFGASGVGFGAAMWGSEPLIWGSEVSFANNGVRRLEMWGSWPQSPPTLVPLVTGPKKIGVGLFLVVRVLMKFTHLKFYE